MSASAGFMKLLDMSLLHVDQSTAAALTTDGVDGVISYPKAPWGAFVYVPSVQDGLEISPETPQGLRLCLEYGQKVGAAWIMFDIDATPIQELPVHAHSEGEAHVAA